MPKNKLKVVKYDFLRQKKSLNETIVNLILYLCSPKIVLSYFRVLLHFYEKDYNNGCSGNGIDCCSTSEDRS